MKPCQCSCHSPLAIHAETCTCMYPDRVAVRTQSGLVNLNLDQDAVNHMAAMFNRHADSAPKGTE